MERNLVFSSGCYIVKDEEEFIERSLVALRPFVDELVVYDTGSTDRTREIASAVGATVIEGYWDDDFGAARNRAMKHCSGEWVVCVDADEIATGDVRAWRRALRTATEDVILVRQVSDTWGGAGSSTSLWANRVLRRARCYWLGAVHEQVKGHWGALSAQASQHLVLQHHGYTVVRFREKDKGGRNLAISLKALRQREAAGEADLDGLRVDVGRSACAASQHQLALEVLEEIVHPTVHPPLAILAGHAAIRSALALEELRTAAVWLDRIKSWGEGAEVCRALEGRIALAEGDAQRAETVLRAVRDGRDYAGNEFLAVSVVDKLVEALVKQGKNDEAVALMIPHIASGASDLTAASAVLSAREVPGGEIALAQAIPPSMIKSFVAQLGTSFTAVADEFFEAMWTAGNGRMHLLAAVSGQWETLPVDRALVWSLRLREAGLEQYCPLRRMAAATERDDRTRLLSAAVLMEIGETEVFAVLEPLLAAVAASDVEDVLTAVKAVAPGFAASLERT